jgi:pyruvate/2-oxoglutarate dehydrogenase complex dihydrolipoamide acyltransferase (E2) component
MRVPIVPPDLGTPARLSLWCVKPGDDVRRGDRIAEVVIPGVLADVLAPASGILAERTTHVGEVITDAIGVIVTGAES